MPKDLKYFLKQAGVSKAALKAPLAAIGFNGTELALGIRGMGALSAIEQRAAIQFRQLFAGVNPAPVVRAANQFSQLVNGNTASGKAMAGIFNRVFTGFFGAIERAEPYATAFVKGILIGAQEIEIAYLRAALALDPLVIALGGVDSAPIDGITVAAKAASLTFEALALVIDGVAAGIREIKALNDQIVRRSKTPAEQDTLRNREADKAAKDKADAEVYARGRQEVYTSVDGAKPTLAEVRPAMPPDAAKETSVPVGKAVADGVMEGMAQGKAAVMAGGEDLGKAAVAGARKGADAHSPSRATMQLGRDMGEGQEIGLAQAKPGVQAAADRSLAPDLRGAARASGGASAAVGGGPILVQVHHHWPADVAKADRQQTESAADLGTLRALRTIAAQLGVPVELAT